MVAPALDLDAKDLLKGIRALDEAPVGPASTLAVLADARRDADQLIETLSRGPETAKIAAASLMAVNMRDRRQLLDIAARLVLAEIPPAGGGPAKGNVLSIRLHGSFR